MKSFESCVVSDGNQTRGICTLITHAFESCVVSDGNQTSSGVVVVGNVV